METTKSAVERLKEKIEAGYKECCDYWMQKSPDWLIMMAEEIVAVKQMREELADLVTEEDAEYLLRFKNPLEVVSDQWTGIIDSSVDTGDMLRHIIIDIQDRRDAEQNYELEPAFMHRNDPPQPASPQQMSM